MAFWDHNVFLGEQVLDSVLGDDVLDLGAGRRGRCRGPARQELSKEGGGTPPISKGSRKHGPARGWSGKNCPSLEEEAGCSAEVGGSCLPGYRLSLGAAPSDRLLS